LPFKYVLRLEKDKVFYKPITCTSRRIKWEIISGCSNCGKSKEEIIKALREKRIDLKKKLEELEKGGLPTVITTEVPH
jgi:hypothetical protein